MGRAETATKEAPTLGSYSILKEIKKDGWGILYEAVKTQDRTPILLRVISPSISSGENFIVRFDLLKTFLSTIHHNNLLKIEELGALNNIFFIARELPAENASALQTLQEFDARDTPCRHSTVEALFLGIAEGLSALENVHKSYFKKGITHDFLTPDNIYITYEKPLVGSHRIPVPKIDGYAEAFLFFGEGFAATLHQHMVPALFSWKEASEETSSSEQKGPLFQYQHFFPFHARHGFDLDHSFAQYSFGSLVYRYFTNIVPKGTFPSLQEIDPTLDPVWDDVINRCLSSPYNQGFANMREVVNCLGELSKKRSQLPPTMQKLEELEIPKGMALVAIIDKVELGAADGPFVERPRFKAKIKPFFIDIAPVTCEQFSAFQASYQRSTHSNGDQHPATLVTWHMAKAYCKWRSESEGLPPDTYRLPSEYEWEAAVRGASGHQYPYGLEIDLSRLHCNHDESCGAFPVKQLSPGRFGLYDMLGNVWEWTESLFQPHPFSKHVEKGYASNLFVVKGGCWYTSLATCRASLRAAFKPNERRGNIGFRLARSIDLGDESAQKA